ncbi:hypothetical protein C1884_09285 [Pseudomonas sp. GW460-R15]|nr:hypothetical protein C1887_11640 [Pseudomonas sp. GW456-R21]POA68532.1 hypothetical protein C1884_09285 [Pseudomonas sp. GW460-R15]
MTALRFFFVKYRYRLKSSLDSESWSEDTRTIRADSQENANDSARQMLPQEMPDHVVEILDLRNEP